MRKLDARVPLIETYTLEEEVRNSLWQERLVTLLSGFFGVIAVLVSALGLYGSLAYSVARRGRELEIRIAIGAQVADIVRTVCARITWFVAIGLLAGVLGSVALLRMAGALLFGVSSVDLFSLSAAVLLLLLCSAMAAVSPSRRAAKTDPIVALREE